ncbi:MAG: c-type cytochrome [Panacibacter sp.]
MKYLRKSMISLILVSIVAIAIFCKCNTESAKEQPIEVKKDSLSLKTEWQAPDTNSIAKTEEGNLIHYGKNLIANTATYLGPKGTVAHISNGMNCQNCHIDAGTKLYGNSFSAVASIYPTFRPRSGRVESIEFRINDCMQRSLNGKTMDSLSREMRAMVAYLKWIGKDVPKGVKPKGSGTEELPFMDRPADPEKGKIVYASKCQSCHQQNGQGLLKPDSATYLYPPLWGPHSYNVGAGLYRLTRFAGYVKNSMPFGATYQNPQLTNEEAWDVGAFVNSQPRPKKSFPHDWSDLGSKAIDHPFGPYKDNFSETQHKYGPFGPIKKAKDSTAKQAK